MKLLGRYSVNHRFVRSLDADRYPMTSPSFHESNVSEVTKRSHLESITDDVFHCDCEDSSGAIQVKGGNPS